MYKQHLPYIFAIAISALAQTLMYLSRIAKGEVFKWLEFFSSVFISATLGLLICMFAHSQGLSFEACGALSGLAGFLGKEAVTFIEVFIKNKLGMK